MPSIKQMDLGLWIVALERLRARRQEERIVLSPHREKRRPRHSEVVLEFRVEGDVALVVAEKVELHFISAGPCEIEVVE